MLSVMFIFEFLDQNMEIAEIWYNVDLAHATIIIKWFDSTFIFTMLGIYETEYCFTHLLFFVRYRTVKTLFQNHEQWNVDQNSSNY